MSGRKRARSSESKIQESPNTQRTQETKEIGETVKIRARYRFDNRDVEDSLMLVEPEMAPLLLGTRFMSREIDRIEISLLKVNEKKANVSMKPWDATYKKLAKDIRDKKVQSVSAEIKVKKGSEEIYEEENREKKNKNLARLEADREKKNTKNKGMRQWRDTDVHGMFEWVVWLEDAEGLEDLVTEKTKELQNMFAECKRLKRVKGTENWDTRNVENASFMFKGCRSMAEAPDISKWDMGKCLFLAGMFQNCKSLKKMADISKWNTESTVDVSLMFMNCRMLNKVPDISKWSTKSMKRMNSIFWGCTSLVEVPDISKWDTKKVKNMSGLFRGCASLISIPDISGWDTREVGKDLEETGALLFYMHDMEGLNERCNPNVEYQGRDIFEDCPNMIAEHMRKHLFCKHYLEHRMDIGRINIFNIYFPEGMELTPWG